MSDRQREITVAVVTLAGAIAGGVLATNFVPAFDVWVTVLGLGACALLATAVALVLTSPPHGERKALGEWPAPVRREIGDRRLESREQVLPQRPILQDRSGEEARIRVPSPGATSPTPQAEWWTRTTPARSTDVQMLASDLPPPLHSYTTTPGLIAQCPRCGDFRLDVAQDDPDYRFRCRHCAHLWRWTSGTPWPAVVVRRNLPTEQS